MICPYCAHDKTFVVCTITDIVVERYRKCYECGASFATVETIKLNNELNEYSKIQNKTVINKKK